MGSYTSELSNKDGGVPDTGPVMPDLPGGACTQQVARLKNPETGETVQATDGCQIQRLKERGWVPATESSSEDDAQQQATAAGLSGHGTIALIALAGVGYSLYRYQNQ